MRKDDVEEDHKRRLEEPPHAYRRLQAVERQLFSYPVTTSFFRLNIMKP